jgi:hypothetical protein
VVGRRAVETEGRGQNGLERDSGRFDGLVRKLEAAPADPGKLRRAGEAVAPRNEDLYGIERGDNDGGIDRRIHRTVAKTLDNENNVVAEVGGECGESENDLLGDRRRIDAGLFEAREERGNEIGEKLQNGLPEAFNERGDEIETLHEKGGLGEAAEKSGKVGGVRLKRVRLLQGQRLEQREVLPKLVRRCGLKCFEKAEQKSLKKWSEGSGR